jgi:hypothetical protein
LEDELTENEQKELLDKGKYYRDLVNNIFNTVRFEFANSLSIDFIRDTIHFILFDRSEDFIIYLDGYDEGLGLFITDKGIEKIGNLNSLYDSIRIRSTQGEVFTLDDYYNACLTFWYKIK